MIYSEIPVYWNVRTTEQPQAHNKKEAKMNATLEEQIETLKASARGYMMMAMVLKEAGYEDSMKAYLKSEVECTVMALELEAQLEELNSYMMAA